MARIKISELALSQLGIKTEQYINGGNAFHGRLAEPTGLPITNLSQTPVGGDWYCDVPDNDAELAAKFGQHFIGRRSDGTPVIAGLLV